jgi:hypothetical protein
MRWRQALRGLVGVALLLAARDAAAVLVFVTGQSEPLRGLLLRENEHVVVVQVFGEGETTEEMSIPRARIEDIVRSVSVERLETLDPTDPNTYREYAEELADKRKDPDAHWTALRLFHIAAYLDPERLGRSCLLAMVPLARNAAEERRFRALAHLFDGGHDPELLRPPGVPATLSHTLDPGQVERLLQPLRLLRQGKRRDALTQARRVKLKEQLPELTATITYEEFERACEPVCPHCQRGRQICRECRGKKSVPGKDGTRAACSACGGRGDRLCPECGGDYQSSRLATSLLKRILQLELELELNSLPGDLAPAPSPRPPWSHTARLGRLAPVLPVTLETLTEFDPRRARYRDGTWIE